MEIIIIRLYLVLYMSKPLGAQEVRAPLAGAVSGYGAYGKGTAAPVWVSVLKDAANHSLDQDGDGVLLDTEVCCLSFNHMEHR